MLRHQKRTLEDTTSPEEDNIGYYVMKRGQEDTTSSEEDNRGYYVTGRGQFTIYKHNGLKYFFPKNEHAQKQNEHCNVYMSSIWVRTNAYFRRSDEELPEIM